MDSWSQVTQGSSGRRRTTDPLYLGLRGLLRWGTFSEKLRESMRKVLVTQLCYVQLFDLWLFVTSWTVAHQVPLSMEFFRQEYWSGLPFPSARGYSWPRDRTQVSFIVGRFFTVWATRIQGNPRQIQTHQSLSLGVSVAHMPKLAQLRLRKPNCS